MKIVFYFKMQNKQKFFERRRNEFFNEDKEIYLIPKEKINNRNTLNLCEKYEQLKEPLINENR